MVFCIYAHHIASIYRYLSWKKLNRVALNALTLVHCLVFFCVFQSQASDPFHLLFELGSSTLRDSKSGSVNKKKVDIKPHEVASGLGLKWSRTFKHGTFLTTQRFVFKTPQGCVAPLVPTISTISGNYHMMARWHVEAEFPMIIRPRSRYKKPL